MKKRYMQLQSHLNPHGSKSSGFIFALKSQFKCFLFKSLMVCEFYFLKNLKYNACKNIRYMFLIIIMQIPCPIISLDEGYKMADNIKWINIYI